MIIKNGLVYLKRAKDLVKTDIRIESSTIIEIGSFLEKDKEIIDAEGLIVLPGVIDPHVHFNDPGHTKREDFYTGTCAAAAGGVTTVIDMPCTSNPPVTNLKNLFHKLDIVDKKAVVDFGLFGGVSGESFKDNLSKNMKELSKHVLGFKTYFISSTKNFSSVNHYQFQKVLEESIDYSIPVLLHAEDLSYIEEAEKDFISGKGSYDYYMSRPEIAEIIAISTALSIVNSTGGELHIVHVSTSEGVRLLMNSAATCETAPHYLAFNLADFKRIRSPLKVSPCIKTKENQDRLWKLLSGGAITFVASDHAPCPEKMKNTDSIWTDYSGIPGIETSLLFLFSEGYKKGKLSISRLIEITSTAAAKRYGLFHRKGSISIGKDADLVLINPFKKTKILGRKFFSRGKVTPFENRVFKGKIEKTIVRGRVVFDSDKGICVLPGYGSYLQRENV